MITKKILIEIPEDKEIPDKLHKLTPEESYYMLKIGSECIYNSKLAMLETTHSKIYNEIKEDMGLVIKNLETQLQIEKSVNERILILEQNISCKKENEYQDRISNLMNNKEEVIQYYDKANDELKTNINEINYLLKSLTEEKNYNSMTEKGIYGENLFQKIAYDTFKDFEGFDIKDVSKIRRKGDFLLNYRDFDIMVDIKNYKNNVSCEQREKMIRDFKENTHIHFAWLISLNSYIDRYDKGTIMYEWIEGNRCICYINNLLNHKNPNELLKSVWYSCNELYKLVIKDHNEESIEEYNMLKDKNIHIMEKIRILKKNMGELRYNINSLNNTYIAMDENIKEILNNETNNIINNINIQFKKWWNNNIEECLDEDIKPIKSKDLWFIFKKTLGINDKEINIDQFKKLLTEYVPVEYIIKLKGKNSGLEIKNIKIKETTNTINSNEEETEEPIIVINQSIKKEKRSCKIKEEEKELYENNNEDSNLEENIKTHKRKNIKKNIKDPEIKDLEKIKDPEIKDLEKTIKNIYTGSENTILQISKILEIPVFKIISSLINEKIINKRSDARGYNEYIQTDEYKNKINNS